MLVKGATGSISQYVWNTDIAIKPDVTPGYSVWRKNSSTVLDLIDIVLKCQHTAIESVKSTSMEKESTVVLGKKTQFGTGK